MFADLYGNHATSEQLFKIGDTVKVLKYDVRASLFRRPHLRTPGYLFGKRGTIQSVAGMFLPPEQVRMFGCSFLLERFCFAGQLEF